MKNKTKLIDIIHILKCGHFRKAGIAQNSHAQNELTQTFLTHYWRR